jgi:hypothetical protein
MLESKLMTFEAMLTEGIGGTDQMRAVAEPGIGFP